MPTDFTSVLIVGAGPAGLAMAIELGSRGVSCLVIERNDRVGYAPRAKTTHVRTREHLRRWGIAKKLAEASPFGVNYPSNVVFVTRLAGDPLAKFENAFNCDPTPDDAYSEHAQWIPQYKLEEVLREHAESLDSVRIRFNCEYVESRQTVDAVESQLKDVETGEEFRIISDYLVGADGARSRVRDVIGAKLEGVYGLSRNYNIVFRAAGLEKAHRHGQAIMYWQVNPDSPSLIGPMDSGDRWFFMPTGVPEGTKLTDEEASALIRRATGIDLPYEILSTDEWTASRFIADRYRQDRIFLVGDACHLHPPFGGYGMNMGITDSVDLGWKMAAVLQNWGGPSLLDSYAAERKPLHGQIIDEAVANHALLGNQLWREGMEDQTAHGAALRAEIGSAIQTAKRREFKSLGVVLGYSYDTSPIICHEEADSPSDSRDYRPSARPGHRAPHIWLGPDASLYDRFGPAFTLLVDGALSQEETDSIRQDASHAAVPLEILELADPRIALLYQARLTLIRPDQHVAWRADHWPGMKILAFAAGLSGSPAGTHEAQGPTRPSAVGKQLS